MNRRRSYSAGVRAPDFVVRVAAGLLVAWLITSGCAVVKHGTSATENVFQSLTGKGSSAGSTNMMAIVQSGVMREADMYAGNVAQATDDFRARVPTIEARNLAQQWKLTQATAAFINATGDNPILDAVDLVVLATLSRYVVEDYWVGERFGSPALPLLAVHRQLETNAWEVAAMVLTPSQQDEIRVLLTEYRQKYPHLQYVTAVRMPELAGTLGKIPLEERNEKPNGLFSLLSINPLAGLDPTTQAIQQTRMLARRAMYYAERAPMLLGWQVELTTYQMAVQPEARQVLGDVNQVAQSTKVFAQTAGELPKLVDEQRKAAINQIFDRLAMARTNLLADLPGEEARLRGLLDEARRTLDAGTRMSDSVNTTTQTLDAFIRSVSPPDTNAVPATSEPKSAPFNVLDYGVAAQQIGAMATNLNTLLQTATQSETAVSRVSKQATVDAKDVVDHAFRLAALLIVLLGVVQAGVVWFHRRMAPGSVRP
jgi:hypothetical protein